MSARSKAKSQAPEHIPGSALRRAARSRFGVMIGRDALRDFVTVALPVLLVITVAFWAASRFVRPAPPRSFVISTGAPEGAYHLYAQRYREILAREGIDVKLRPSAGSVENLRRLEDAASGVEVALIQGGIGGASNPRKLVSLGSLYYEPLWIFYRGPAKLSLLKQLEGKTVAVGAEGSGTRALGMQLLGAVGIHDDPAKLLALGGSAAAQALMAGQIDAAFVVGSPEAPLVQRLVKADGIRLLSLENAEAFARHFPFLTAVNLPRGVVDLASNVPKEDVSLLAATANLVVREEFHPALAFLLLHAASEVHSPPGLLHRYKEFPTERGYDFALSDQAARYYRSGPPLLRRYLPFWLANLIERMLVLIVPLLAVLIPALKLLPAFFDWRIKSRIFRWYGRIAELEDELARAPDSASPESLLARLDEIEQGVRRTSVPRTYTNYIYNLRTHIDVVRNRVARIYHTESRSTHAGTDLEISRPGVQAP